MKQPTAVQEMDQLVLKLAPFQGILGLMAMGVAIGFVVMG